MSLGRIKNFSGLLTEANVFHLIEDTSLQILQTDQHVDAKTWELLEALFFRKRPDVTLRIYGNADSDLGFLKRIPSLTRFEANCLKHGSNLEFLADLVSLDYLNIGIESLESFDFLYLLNPNLKTLSLGPTKSAKPQITGLRRLTNLESLGLCGNRKNLDVLGYLGKLEKLTLISSKDPDLSFLGSLTNLWSLGILLGGATDLSDITACKSLKHLELCWIRGLSDISFISQCTSLQRLSLDRLKQVQRLPDFKDLKKLRRLTVAGMNGLKSVDNIYTAPALEVFGGSAEKLLPEDFTKALQAPSLRAATVYFQSQKKSNAYDELARKYGINFEPKWEEFVFN